METTEKLNIGFTGTYIRDFNFEYIVKIPVEIAVSWVKNICPDVKMHPSSDCKASEMKIDANDKEYFGLQNMWFNKLFVIIEIKGDEVFAINNHDGEFYLMKK